MRPLPTQLSATPPARQSLSDAGQPVRGARHPEHRLLADFLDRARDVEIALDQVGLRHPRRRAEQLVERPVGHREAAEIVEVLLVQRERAVVPEVDHFVEQQLDVLRLAVGASPMTLYSPELTLKPR